MKKVSPLDVEGLLLGLGTSRIRGLRVGVSGVILFAYVFRVLLRNVGPQFGDEMLQLLLHYFVLHKSTAPSGLNLHVYDCLDRELLPLAFSEVVQFLYIEVNPLFLLFVFLLDLLLLRLSSLLNWPRILL